MPSFLLKNMSDGECPQMRKLLELEAPRGASSGGESSWYQPKCRPHWVFNSQ